jgi:hypothetical protein
MKIEDARIALRLRTLPEVFDLSILVATRGAAGLFARLAVITLVPAYLVALAAHYLAEVNWLALLLGLWTYASFVQGLFTVAVGQWLLSSDTPNVRSVLVGFRQHFGRFLGAWFLSRFLYAPMLLLVFAAAAADQPLIGPGADVEAAVGFVFLGLFALALLWPAHQTTLFLYEAALLEQAGPVTAIKRSRQFVRAVASRSWSASMLLVVVWCGALYLGDNVGRALVETVLQTGYVAPGTMVSGGSPYAALGLLAVVPLLAAFRFVLYIDGRTRVDGWDVQVAFMALAAQNAHRQLRRAA